MTAETLPDTSHRHGLVDGLPMADYLAVPALSASSARRLLPPSCPALYRWEQDHPQTTPAMDFGKVAHSVILEGLRVEDVALEVPGDWRTKTSKALLEQAEEQGLVPLHTKDAEAARGMVDAIRRHPVAAALFDPDGGRAEVSMFWETRGVPRKGRLDFLPERRRSGRLIIPDLKSTSGSAHPTEFGRTVVNFGYAQQLMGYEEGVRALGLDDDPQFLLLVQEVKPPYLIKPLELPDDAKAIGRELNLWAGRVYAECVEKGEWPGYDESPEYVQMPQWWLNQYEEMK